MSWVYVTSSIVNQNLRKWWNVSGSHKPKYVCSITHSLATLLHISVREGVTKYILALVWTVRHTSEALMPSSSLETIQPIRLCMISNYVPTMLRKCARMLNFSNGSPEKWTICCPLWMRSLENNPFPIGMLYCFVRGFNRRSSDGRISNRARISVSALFTATCLRNETVPK